MKDKDDTTMEGEQTQSTIIIAYGHTSYLQVRLQKVIHSTYPGARRENPESVPPQTRNGQPDTGRPTALQ